MANATIRIETLHVFEGVLTTLHGPAFIPNCGGHADPKAAIREIRRRFKHRNPRPYENGLELDGDSGTIQRITFCGSEDALSALGA